jgi:alkanesulfonate monooxygenase SsuD/methylene tetrahydromethanopterin reductase-like flavin-dependent oxidoreductase (luciferase family)
MDYGHALEFGIFLTPEAQDAQEVLRVARLADTLGLDYVGIQDYPYQRAHLETVALLSAIANTTRRIRVQSQVMCLPLRLPALLSKEFATIDLLAGPGRTELGLGAGAFWQAIKGYGGPVRAPGEAVQALEEAITIIRGMWTEQAGVRFTGDYYTVQGIRPGPIPSSPIPIGIGSIGPRMLALTGRLADDWFSSGRTTIEMLPDSNGRIDAGARAADRDPSAIRRTYGLNMLPGLEQLDAQQWVAHGKTLALDHGISRFSLIPAAGDWDTTLHFVAEEVAPALREQVARERRRSSEFA